MKEDQKIVIYQTEDGKTQSDVRLENETVWLTQAQMAELLEKDQSVVARAQWGQAPLRPFVTTRKKK